MYPQIWPFDRHNKHDWAFYYYCKKQGDVVEIHGDSLLVWRAGYELQV